MVLSVFLTLAGCTTSDFEYQEGTGSQPDCGDACADECPVGSVDVGGQCVLACGPWSAIISAGGPVAAILVDDRVVAVGTNPLESGRVGESWAIAVDACQGEPVAGAQPWAAARAQTRGAALFQQTVYVTGTVAEPAGVFISRLSKTDLAVQQEDTLALAVPEPRVHATVAAPSGVWLAGSSATTAWAAKTDGKSSCSIPLSESATSVQVAVAGDSVWIATSDGHALSLFEASDAGCNTTSCGCNTQPGIEVQLPAELVDFDVHSVAADATHVYVAGSAGIGSTRRGVLLELAPSGAVQKLLELDLSPGPDEIVATLLLEGALYAAISTEVDSAQDARTVLRRYPLPLADAPATDVVLGAFRAASISAGPDGDVVIAGDASGSASLFRCDSAGICSTTTMPSPMPP